MAPLDLIAHAVSRLGAAASMQLEAAGCRCEFEGWALALHCVAGDAFVTGVLDVETLSPDGAARRAMFAVFANAGLTEELGVPAWFAVDPRRDVLELRFACALEGAEPEGLADVVRMASKAASQVFDAISPA